MYSSVKFFVPRTIVGFAAAFVLAAPAPAASRPMRSATPSETANAALAARRVCLRTIPCPPFELPSPQTLCPGGHPAVGHVLQEPERGGDEERHGRDAVGRAEHPGRAVRLLVGDDVAEPPAADDAGDRRGRDHEDGRDPQAREDE